MGRWEVRRETGVRMGRWEERKERGQGRNLTME